MMKVHMLALVVLSLDAVWGMALQNASAVGSPFSDDLLDPQVHPLQDLHKDKPTLHRFEPFDPNVDVAVLLKAVKGVGTDEEAIIGLLTNRTSDQRHKILKTYNTVYYDRNCIDDLQGELTGNFDSAITALMTPLPQYLAQELHRTIHGPGTKEIKLIEILYSLNNTQIFAVKNAYNKEYEKHLVDDMKDKTSGDFQRILLSMCDGKQDEKDVYSALANSIAHTLHTAGGNRSGTDESEFRRIMTSYSYPLLKMVFEEYKKNGGNNVSEAINSELSGDLKKGVKAIYDIVVNRPAFYAKELHDCMSKSVISDATLIRLVLLRSEIDMQNIKEEYLKLYKKTLADKIKEVTSGYYKEVLLALVEGKF